MALPRNTFKAKYVILLLCLMDFYHNPQPLNYDFLLEFNIFINIILNSWTMLKWLVLSLAISCSFCAITVDLAQKNQYQNQTIYNTPCNKDTQIDFFLSSDSKVSCTTSVCTTSGLGSTYMKYMDINGNDLVLYLTAVQTASNTDVVVQNLGLTPNYYYLLRFDSDGGAHKVFVAVPIVTTSSSLTSVVDVTFSSVSQSFPGFQNPSTSKTIDMTTFSFLNYQDCGKFYHVTDSSFTNTMLISAVIYKLSGQLLNIAPLTSAFSFTPNYAASGNFLCYGSNQVQGLFQTHLRESWPLWTWIISVIIYWMYYLLAESDTHQCYDKRFQQNKLTCWGFYSLHYLGHIQYFTRLTRVSLLYFVFSFQAMILAAVYSRLGQNKAPYTNFQMIIWAAAIALGASLPIPFIMGGIFLRGIYKTTLQKFRVIQKSRGTMMNKAEQQAIYQKQIDKLQQRSYTYYYWYYIVFFIGMVCFWVPAIYMMMQIHRNWYYLQRIWLASLAITSVLDNLILDPLFSFLLGNTKFYRARGYFYQFALGQQYKQIEE